MINLLLMNRKFTSFLLVCILSTSVAFAQKVLIGNVYYKLSAADHTAGVTFESRDSAANYANVTAVSIQPQVVYQGARYTVTHIEPRAFANSALQNISLPASVTTIADEAFYNCASLQNITLPANLTSIGTSAFYHCVALPTIRIPNSVTTIGDYVFEDCAGLRSVILPTQLTEIRPYAFANCSLLVSISMPASLTMIHRSAFANCTSLQTVAIPNNVEYIGEGAFAGCTSLSNVRLPNSLVDVGEGIFEGCTSLIRPVYTQQLFIYMPPTYQGYYTIPNGIEAIIEGAFAGCTGLTNIKIPASVQFIDEEEFSDCTNLPVVEGIRYADTYLAEVVDKYLPSYTVRTGTRWIAEEAFAWLNGMTTVTLPASLTTIGEEAFLQCMNLSAIYNYATTPQYIDYNVFAGQHEWKDYEEYAPVDKSTCILYVPAESVNLYRNAEVWGDFVHILPIGAPQGIDDTNDESRLPNRKILIDGRILIRQGDRTYTLTGTQVNQ